MTRRVGICAVAQTAWERDLWDRRFQGMVLEVVTPLLERTGLTFDRDEGIGMAISVSDDIFDARTISDGAMTDVLGAHFGCEEKVAQEGLQAIYYAYAAVASGHVDTVLVVGHCKESQAQSRNMVTHLSFDPFYTRPLGLDFCAAAGLQARAYASRSGLTDEHLAEVVVRARRDAAKNPFVDVPVVTKDEVMSSPMLADPIRELHAYPVTDGAVGLIVAAEEVALRVTERPVWITGVGNAMGRFFLGDRDLASVETLEQAAIRAYERAGIGDPTSAFDVVELSDQYAYQRPMWAEGLGLCERNEGPAFVTSEGDGPALNPSGGMLAGNPLILGGLVRAAEAALQLRGEAGERQIEGARTALAHGVMGPAGQLHSVATLAVD